MTMAKPGLAQDQTVEEILASIRQVINGDQSRSPAGAMRPATGVMPASRSPAASSLPPRAGTVTPIHGGRLAASGDQKPEGSPARGEGDATPADQPAERSQMHDVIEMAIEQALDGVRPDETRAETGASGAADTRRPLRADVRPRVEPPSAHEAPRAVEPALRPAPPPVSRGLLSPRANAAVAASFDDLARELTSRGARQIDQAVEDLLRPMLKSWLEDNLPPLVERLVREEIERVSRGRR